MDPANRIDKLCTAAHYGISILREFGTTQIRMYNNYDLGDSNYAIKAASMAILFKKMNVKRFAGFLDSGTLALADINIFIGPNSAGKSSLLHVPLVLKQTLDDINPENRLITDGKLIGMGSFGDVIYSHDEKQSLDIGFTLDSSHLRRQHLLSQQVGDIPDSFQLEFGITSRAKRTYIKSFKFFKEGGRELVEGAFTPLGKLKTWKTPLISDSKPRFTIDFHHFLPAISFTAKSIPPDLMTQQPTPLRDFFERMWVFRQVCQSVFSSVIYLQPIRIPIRAADRVTGESPVSVGSTGENLLGVLYREGKRGERGKKRLLAHLNHWLDKRLQLVRDIHIEPLTKSGSLFALTGKDSKSNIYVNLAAVGFGVSQVAPIIVQGFLSPESTALIMEQPEIHLHPAAQAELGDLFIQFAEEGKQLFIETHSQYLLFRIQRRIAEGKLPADKVRVFFVSRGETGSEIRQLTLDERGRVRDWPQGFFEEGYIETSAIAEALTK